METEHPVLDLVNYIVSCLSSFFSDFKDNGKKILIKFYEKHKDSLWTFLWLVLCSFAIFGYTLVVYNFTIPLSGDGYLQSQTMPFQMYDLWHSFFKNGHLDLWDYSTGFGVNSLGANSFYGMFSPFTLLTLPFPRSWLPQLISILYILRISLGGLFFYFYLKSFHISMMTRRIGAVAFAFCGWVTYYLWFAFYLDSFAFFPLILYGIEKIFQKKDPRLLILAFFLEGLCNYFFFVVFMIGAFFYAVFRYVSLWKTMGDSQTRWAVLGMGVTAFALGIMMVTFLLLPGILNAQAMPRVDASSYLTDLTTAYREEGLSGFLKVFFQFDYNSENYPFKKVYPLTGFFFFNMASFNNNLLPINYYDNISGSSYIFMPMMILCFVGYLYAFKKKRLAVIIGGFLTIFIIAVPFFYYLFSAFTVGYARFYLLPISWMIAFACKTLEERKDIKRSYLDAAMVLIILLQITTFTLALWGINTQFEIFENGYPFNTYPFWTRLLILPFQFIIDVVCYLVMRRYFHGKNLGKFLFVLVSIEAIAMGNTVIMNHGFGNLNALENSGNRGYDIVSNETDLIAKLKAFDPSTYRVFNSTADRNNPNINLTIGHNGLSAFNSNYAFSIQDFLNWSNIPYTSRNWSMGEHNRRSDVENFLGVKYYMVRHGFENGYKLDNNIPWNYENILNLDPSTVDENQRDELETLKTALMNQQADGYIARDLYYNKDYIDLGFSFDTILTSSAFREYNYTDYNEYAYTRYAIVDSDALTTDQDLQSDITKYGIKQSTLSTTSQFGLPSFNFTFDLTRLTDVDAYQGTVRYYDFSYPLSFTRERDRYVDQDHNLSFTLNSDATLNFTGFNANNLNVSYTEVDTVLSFTFLSSIIQRQNNMSVTVYASHWDENGRYITGDTSNTSIDHYIYPADTKIDFDSPGSAANELLGLKYYSKVVLENKDGSLFAPNASEDNPTYISTYTPDHYEWHLVGEDGQDVTADLQSNSTYQRSHGFYVRKPIKRIIGYLFQNKDATERISRPVVFVQSYADHTLAMEKQKEYPLDITYARADLIRFSTNYPNNRFVVLNIPRENGWTLRRYGYPVDANDVEQTDRKQGYQEINTYKSQGGFIGFFAPAGLQEFELEFYTPGLSLGSKVTIVGFILTSFIYVSLQGAGLDRLFAEQRQLRCGTYEKN